MMRRIPDPPEMPRRLETVSAFVRSTCGESTRVMNILARGEWPCILCDGRGTIYDPGDLPCPIEGDKMRRRIKCTRCHGTGRADYEDLAQALAREREYWMGRIACENAARAVMLQALAKLTAEEAAALGWQNDESR